MQRARAASDEYYVIDLCDHILGRAAKRQHRFDFLVGDPGRSHRRVRLPVDAYYEDLALVIEFMESQHGRPTPFFDKPGRLTVSGVHRGEQRRLYDERRRQVLPAHGIRLLTIKSECFATRGNRGRKLVRNPIADELVLRGKLAPFIEK